MYRLLCFCYFLDFCVSVSEGVAHRPISVVRTSDVTRFNMAAVQDVTHTADLRLVVREEIKIIFLNLSNSCLNLESTCRMPVRRFTACLPLILGP